MNRIDFTQLGGYRLKQGTFAKIQEAYFEILSGLVGLLGFPEVGNFIIYGCEVVGPDITPGIMYIDGELCPFAGSPGDLTTLIKKDVAVTTLAFKNGTNPPVFRKTSAIVDPAGIALSAFTRADVVRDPNYVHTDVNFTAAMLVHLQSIEAGAQVNVQADWNVTNPLSMAFINNKPTILNVLEVGEVDLADFPNDFPQEQRPINLQANVGTGDYFVLFSLKSKGNATIDNNVWAVTKNHTAISFDLVGEENYSGNQDLTLHYVIIGY